MHSTSPPHLIPRPQKGLIGHRGLAGLAPENTLSALKAAAEHNLSWIEFDVQPCKTGEWFVFHDSHLERTTNGFGRLRDANYDELKSLDAGSWFDARFAQETIPTLEEFLMGALQYNLHPNIEIKLDSYLGFAELDALMKTITALWPATAPLPFMSSFNFPALKFVREAWPQYPTGYLIEQFHPKVLHLVEKLGFSTINCNQLGISLAEIESLLEAGIPLLIYTVNDAPYARKLIELGVTAVFSDLPLL